MLRLSTRCLAHPGTSAAIVRSEIYRRWRGLRGAADSAHPSHPQVQCFLDTCAGVVKKRRQGMIPLSFQSGSIGLGQDCGDFRGFQIADSLPRRPLEWDAPHLGALLSGKRLVCRNEREEAAQCRQPAVPSTDGRLAFLLDILEKGEYRRS